MLPYYTAVTAEGLREPKKKLPSLYLRTMEDLLQKLDQLYRLPESVRSEFIEAWRPLSFPKGHTLLREGSINHYLYFISKGVARIYYYKHEREVTEWLALDGSFFFSTRSFFERVPSHLAIHLLEASELFALHHNDLMRLCDQNHEIEKLFRRMVTSSLLLSQTRMESIQFETAQQRYQRLLNQNPDIVQRVSLGHIASFLGITQETLSRIRAQPFTLDGTS